MASAHHHSHGWTVLLSPSLPSFPGSHRDFCLSTSSSRPPMLCSSAWGCGMGTCPCPGAQGQGLPSTLHGGGLCPQGSAPAMGTWVTQETRLWFPWGNDEGRDVSLEARDLQAGHCLHQAGLGQRCGQQDLPQQSSSHCGSPPSLPILPVAPGQGFQLPAPLDNIARENLGFGFISGGFAIFPRR